MSSSENPWRKSSYSNQSGGACVEVGGADTVLVRDTTDRGGLTLSVPAAAWSAFLATVRQHVGNEDSQ